VALDVGALGELPVAVRIGIVWQIEKRDAQVQVKRIIDGSGRRGGGS
jgi:hypothetical protein